MCRGSTSQGTRVHRLSPCRLHLRTDHSGCLLVKCSCDSQARRWVRRRGFNRKPRGRGADGGKGAQEGRRQRGLSTDGAMPTTAGSRSHAGDRRQAGVGVAPRGRLSVFCGVCVWGSSESLLHCCGCSQWAWAPRPSSGTLGGAGGCGICKLHDAEDGASGRGSRI